MSAAPPVMALNVSSAQGKQQYESLVAGLDRRGDAETTTKVPLSAQSVADEEQAVGDYDDLDLDSLFEEGPEDQPQPEAAIQPEEQSAAQQTAQQLQVQPAHEQAADDSGDDDIDALFENTLRHALAASMAEMERDANGTQGEAVQPFNASQEQFDGYQPSSLVDSASAGLDSPSDFPDFPAFVRAMEGNGEASNYMTALSTPTSMPSATPGSEQLSFTTNAQHMAGIAPGIAQQVPHEKPTKPAPKRVRKKKVDSEAGTQNEVKKPSKPRAKAKANNQQPLQAPKQPQLYTQTPTYPQAVNTSLAPMSSSASAQSALLPSSPPQETAQPGSYQSPPKLSPPTSTPTHDTDGCLPHASPTAQPEASQSQQDQRPPHGTFYENSKEAHAWRTHILACATKANVPLYIGQLLASATSQEGVPQPLCHSGFEVITHAMWQCALKNPHTFALIQYEAGNMDRELLKALAACDVLATYWHLRIHLVQLLIHAGAQYDDVGNVKMIEAAKRAAVMDLVGKHDQAKQMRGIMRNPDMLVRMQLPELPLAGYPATNIPIVKQDARNSALVSDSVLKGSPIPLQSTQSPQISAQQPAPQKQVPQEQQRSPQQQGPQRQVLQEQPQEQQTARQLQQCSESEVPRQQQSFRQPQTLQEQQALQNLFVQQQQQAQHQQRVPQQQAMQQQPVPQQQNPQSHQISQQEQARRMQLIQQQQEQVRQRQLAQQHHQALQQRQIPHQQQQIRAPQTLEEQQAFQRQAIQRQRILQQQRNLQQEQMSMPGGFPNTPRQGSVDQQRNLQQEQMSMPSSFASTLRQGSFDQQTPQSQISASPRLGLNQQNVPNNFITPNTSFNLPAAPSPHDSMSPMSRKRSLSVASQDMSTPTPAAKMARTGSMESPGQAVQQGQMSPAVLQQLSQKHRVPTAVVANALNLQMRQLAARQLQHQQQQNQQAATQQQYQQAAMQHQHQQAALRERAVKQHQQRLQAAGVPSQHGNGQAQVQAPLDRNNPYWAPWMEMARTGS